jgi:hypothetical protein
MPDYSACVNKTCPLRGHCARYLMVWGDYQSVSSFKPVDGKCAYRMPTEDAPFRLKTLDEADAARGE